MCAVAIGDGSGLYIDRAKKLSAVINVTSAKRSLESGLAGYLELDSAAHLNSWFKVRQLANTSKPEHNVCVLCSPPPLRLPPSRLIARLTLCCGAVLCVRSATSRFWRR